MTKALLPEDRRERVELRRSLRRSLRRQDLPFSIVGNRLEMVLLTCALALLLAVPFMRASVKAKDDVMAIAGRYMPGLAPNPDDNILTGTTTPAVPKPRPESPSSRELPVPWNPAPPALSRRAP